MQYMCVDDLSRTEPRWSSQKKLHQLVVLTVATSLHGHLSSACFPFFAAPIIRLTTPARARKHGPTVSRPTGNV